MHNPKNRVETALLRKINERRLLEAILHHGPSSRASLTRASGLTAPTVSKAVDSLLARGLVEELDPITTAIGRPGKLVRMASQNAVVLGLVIDAGTACVVATGLEGIIREERTRRFATPPTYLELLDQATAHCQDLVADSNAKLVGVGVSVPGLVNERLGEIVVSPNLHLLDKRNPARDLETRLGAKCFLIQETEALCLAERLFGNAQGLVDFAMLDVARGLGLGVMSSGELLAGHSGMAGEVGHITIDPDGVRCGCGNRGCLETLATDAALVRLASEHLGQPLTLAETAAILDERPDELATPMNTVTEYLAIAIAAVINIFNPTMLFVHGTLLAGSEKRFASVLERVRQRAITATLADCTIRPTTVSKRKGAVAGVIHHLTQTWAPTIR